MFIDETWIKTTMAPIRGWGPKGERLAGFAPDGRWHTLTFLAALRINALTEPCVVDGPINGTIFRAYIEQFLVPTLRPGDMEGRTTQRALLRLHPNVSIARSSNRGSTVLRRGAAASHSTSVGNRPPRPAVVRLVQHRRDCSTWLAACLSGRVR